MGEVLSKIQKAFIKADLPPLPEGYKRNGQLYQHQRQGVRVKAFTLVLPPSQVQDYIKRMKIRKDHKEELVQIRYVDVKKEQFQYIKMNVYYEYLPISLEQVIKLRWEQMLAILYFAIKGLHWLHQYWGSYFTVQSYMISINEMGQVKTWLNRNAWEQIPKPSYSHKAANPEQAQKYMIEELMQIFQCKCEKKTVPDNFELEGTSFEALTNEIEEKYGAQWLKNNLPLVSELERQNENDITAIEALNFKQSKSENIPRAESSIKESQRGLPSIRFTTCQPTSKIVSSETVPRIKFNYNKQIPRRDLVSVRSVSGIQDRKSPQKINFSYKAQ